MHLVYVDESGDDGFSANNIYFPQTMPKQFFIRSALIVHDKKWQTINQKVSSLKAKWKILPSVEFHATEILNGSAKHYDNKAKRRVNVPNFFGQHYPNKSDRQQLLVDICNLIAEADLTLLAVVIDKAKIQRSRSNYKEMPKNNSWEFLIERINLFLSYQKDNKGMIISDAIQHQIESEHREFVKALYAQSMHIRQSYFVESILFEPSESSLLLQLADIVAFALHRKYNMGDMSYYNLLQAKLFTHNNALLGTGLKIWPD